MNQRVDASEGSVWKNHILYRKVFIIISLQAKKNHNEIIFTNFYFKILKLLHEILAQILRKWDSHGYLLVM